MGTFKTTGGYASSAVENGKNVSIDPRIVDIMQTAASASPYNVEAFSGVQNRSSGTKNHPGGYAMDVHLVDPSTGQVLTNYGGAGYQAQGTWQQNFPAYEQFAQTARVVQQQKYPELDNTFRWGGYWPPGSGNKSGPDLMHFDINPTMGGSMSGSTWNGGASKAFQSQFGVKSNGGLSNPKVSADIQGAIVGHPVPPGSVPPTPMNRDGANLPFSYAAPPSKETPLAPKVAGSATGAVGPIGTGSGSVAIGPSANGGAAAGVGPIGVGGGSIALPSAAPIPLNRTNAPIPMNRDGANLPFSYAAPPDEPQAPAAIPAPTVAPVAAPGPIAGVDKPTVTINGHTYIVGQTYSLSNGATFVPQANGTMLKTANQPRQPTAIQLLIASQQPGAMQNLQKAQNTAGVVASTAGNAASAAGSFIQNLFKGGAPANSTAPAPGLPDPYKPGQGPFSSAAPSVPQTAGPVGQSANSDFFTGDPSSSLPFSYAAPPPQRNISPVTHDDTVQPSTQPVAQRNISAVAHSDGPPITKIVQVANPAYTAWLANQKAPAANGSAIGAVGANGFASGAISIPKAPVPVAAPPKTIPKAITVAVPAPRVATVAAPAASQSSSAGPIAPLPQVQSAGAYNYLPDGKSGYVKVGQVNPGLTPSQAASVAGGGPILTINSGNYGSAGNNNESAHAQMSPGGSLSTSG